MRPYAYPQAALLSLFSNTLYRDIGRNGRGAGLLYALVLVAIDALALLIRLHLGIAHFRTHEAQGLLAQMPKIVVHDGVVSIDAPQPLTIHDPETGKDLAILDTTGQVVSLSGTDAGALLTQNRFVLKRSSGETRVYDLSGIKHLSLDQRRLGRWMDRIAAWFAIMAFPFVLAWIYAGRLIVSLVGAAIVLVAARVMHRGIPFAGAMRVTALAFTPASLTEIVLDVAKQRPPGWGLIWWLISLAYIVFAIASLREARPPAAGSVTAPPPSSAPAP